MTQTGRGVGLRVLRSWSSRLISTGSVSPIASVVPSFAGKGPPPVRFVWGEFRFDGHVEALQETLDFFAPDGRPLRARLALSLRGATLRA